MEKFGQKRCTYNGRLVVPVYNWAAFLERYFKKIPNIPSFSIFKGQSWSSILERVRHKLRTTIYVVKGSSGSSSFFSPSTHDQT